MTRLTLSSRACRNVSLILGLLALARLSRADPPIVPGLAREGLSPRERGRVLLGELGCANCHTSEAAWLVTKRAPDLAAIGSRALPEYLRAYLASPRTTKPGTTMPDVFGRFDAQERADAAVALTHYLVSLSESPLAPESPDRIAAERGGSLFHSVGCVLCHSPLDERGAALLSLDSVPLVALERKYSPSSLAAFLADPLETRPSGRMPALQLSPGEAFDIASYLTREARVPGALRFTVYLERMEEGIDRLDGKEVRAGVVPELDIAPFASVHREEFAVRFEGYLEVPRSGLYTFELLASDTATLSLDGERAIEIDHRRGTPDAPAAKAQLELDAGLHELDLVSLHSSLPVEGDPARLELVWSGPGIPRERVPSGRLRSERAPPPAFASLTVDPELRDRGRALFNELTCASCHGDPERTNLSDTALTPRVEVALESADPDRGCLSSRKGRWPDHGLSPAQIADLRAALAAAREVASDEDEIRADLVRFNCVACHARDGFGGIPEDRDAWVASTDPKLGEAGRLPPPLSGIGAKLQPAWLASTLAHGQRERPYLPLRMPAFGAGNVSRLAERLSSTDSVPPVEFPPPAKGRDETRAVVDLGRTLVGDRGMSCIACHTFRGGGSGTMAAIDLIETTSERLRKDWFYHYMLEPARFQPNTVMPQYFPDGVSILKDFADGDPKTQLDAIWRYLAEGRNTGAPRGLRRPSMEIVVDDETVILRRSAQNTGKRAIAVGDPLGVSFTFDAESVALNQIWRGRFVDAGGVFGGQGSGALGILSRDRVDLGLGPAFAELPDEGTPWPEASSRELGIRFRGYDLDAAQRPTFRYVVGAISVSDAPVVLRDEASGEIFLRRRVEISARTSPQDDGREERARLFFRVATNEEITVNPEGSATLGTRMRVVARSVVPAPTPLAFLLREGTPRAELLLPLPSAASPGAFEIEYHFTEAAR